MKHFSMYQFNETISYFMSIKTIHDLTKRLIILKLLVIQMSILMGALIIINPLLVIFSHLLVVLYLRKMWSRRWLYLSLCLLSFIDCYGSSDQVVCHQTVIREIRFIDSRQRSIVIYYDKAAIIFFSKNNNLSTVTKQMQTKFLTVKILVRQGDIVIQNIGTDKN